MAEIGDRMQLAAVRTLAAGLRVALAGIAHVAPRALLPCVEWPRPAGDQPVGACDLSLGEVAGQALSARCWYPAAVATGEAIPLHPQTLAQALAGSGVSLLPAALLARLGTTCSASLRDTAPDRERRHPVVIFSHGLGGFAYQNTHLAEHLASHGYVVLAIAHPDGAAAIVRPDGHAVGLDAERRDRLFMDPHVFAAARRLRKARTILERRTQLKRYVAMEPLASETQRWAETIGIVLTRLEKKAFDAPVGGLREACDLSRVAAVGMSFGGSASATAAQQDPRIRAAVNLDGGQYGTDLLNRLMRVPLLVLHSDAAACFADGGTYTDFHYEPAGRAGCSSEVIRLRVRGAGHLSFTDMALFGGRAFRSLIGVAGVDGVRMLELTADLVHRFLDQHLRGGPALSIAELTRQWPELTVPDLAAVRAMAVLPAFSTETSR